MTTHDKYMYRCLQLAQNGLGTTYPNPLVGSVIVSHDGKIIGEGWHLKSGQPHAEVNAVRDAEKKGYDGDAFAKAVLYVNLEPCSHTGKTPPCASMIVENGFKKVVVGTLDPHDKVAGKGVQLLKNAGIEVALGVLEKECNELNKRFFMFHKQQRPYIRLKWAQTADGFIAPQEKNEQKPVWITNSHSRQLSHQLRAEENAILIGAQTVIDDNPFLTCRDWNGVNPTRIILDTKNNLDSNFNVFNDDARTIKLNTTLPEEIVTELYRNNIQSVIIEGGARTIQSFIAAGLWDETVQFMGTEVYFKSGLKAPVLDSSFELQSRTTVKNDVIKRYLKK